ERGPWVGCLVPLLPYIEQDNIYKQLWKTPKNFPFSSSPESPGPLINLSLNQERCAWWTALGNVQPQTGQMRLKILKCPSDTTDEATREGCVMATHIANGYIVGLHPEDIGDPTYADALGRTNYTGVAGAAGDCDSTVSAAANFYRRWEGIMFNRSQ